MKFIIKKLIPLIDPLIAILLIPACFIMKGIRQTGIQRWSLCRGMFRQIGLFPIRNHYYEPQFIFQNSQHDFSQPIELNGINWNIDKQLNLLSDLHFTNEIEGAFPSASENMDEFHFNNHAFEAGDAEFLYQLIRLKKPQRIIEVGSGFSSRIAARAIKKNQQENPEQKVEHICIEPYEMPHLEKQGFTVIRDKVENISPAFFEKIEKNDLLFIDSSHIIKPAGDIIHLYLHILPTLPSGVIVHIHDIFSPRNYPTEWLTNEIRLWNEQYLVEAFLTHNNQWEVLATLNLLKHSHYSCLKKVCPYLTPTHEPGSLYIQKKWKSYNE